MLKFAEKEIQSGFHTEICCFHHCFCSLLAQGFVKVMFSQLLFKDHFPRLISFYGDRYLMIIVSVKWGGRGSLVPFLPAEVTERAGNLLSSPQTGIEVLNVKPRTCPKGRPFI